MSEKRKDNRGRVLRTGELQLNTGKYLYRYTDKFGTMAIRITKPKTKAGNRSIPLMPEVKQAFDTLRVQSRCIDVIDGYSGFVFSNRFGHCLVPHSVNRAIERIVRDANKDVDAVQLPHFTCHNLRHTFCTRLCENESNLKVIQEIMGHRDIGTTLGIYAEATREKKVESFYNLNGKIFV